MAGTNNISKRVYIVFAMFAALMVAVIVKASVIQLEVVESELFDAHQVDTLRRDSIQPIRGNILAANGEMLSTSIPEYDIYADFTVVDSGLFYSKVDTLAMELTQLIGQRDVGAWSSYMKSARENGRRYQMIARKLKHGAMLEMKELPIFERGQNRGGLIIVRNVKRKHPYDQRALRTVGYVRPKENLAVGLEAAYNTELTGIYGQQMLQMIAKRWRPVSENYLQDPVDGADVITSIDINMQDLAESELEKQLRSQEAYGGCVVLMEVETGYIKAIANLRRQEDGSYRETYNDAVGTASQPGSTFKLATFMAALEDGMINIDDTVMAGGSYRFYDRTFHDSRREGYGRISLQQAFEYSSQVIAKVVSQKYGDNPQMFIDRLKSFGIDQPLGVEIPGEGSPLIKNAGEDGWSGVSLPSMCIGYEVETTPLQTLALYNAVANGGKMVKPQFVTKIVRGGQVLQENEPVVLNDQICSDKTVEALQKCMEGVVQRGTAKRLRKAHLSIAGKTGTARWYSGGSYGAEGKYKYQASFAGYFPAEKPKYSCIVVISDPKQQIYGSVVSGEVFRALAERVYASSLKYHDPVNIQNDSVPTVIRGTYKYVDLIGQTTFPIDVDAEDINTSIVRLGYDNGFVVRDKKEIAKPTDVKGMLGSDAVEALEKLGYKVSLKGKGRVRKIQEIPDGTSLKNIRVVLELAL